MINIATTFLAILLTFPTSNFIDFQPVKTVNVDKLGTVLADIESRIPPKISKDYEDRVLWAHERSHQLNAIVREGNIISGQNRNGFYLLQGRAVLVNEPKIEIFHIERFVPKSWRWKLSRYLNDNGWTNHPLYLFDEFVAYRNGAECAIELKYEFLDHEIAFTTEFLGYCLTLLYTTKQLTPNYEDKDLKNLFIFLAKESKSLRDRAGGSLSCERIKAISSSEDGVQIRTFAISYFGHEFCKKYLDF